MVSRKTFDEVGGWNETFELCGGDVELCLRISRSGRRIVCTPFARVKHLEGSTRRGAVPQEDYFSSFWAYQKYLKGGDPYFNPNLSYFDTVPRLSHPDDPGPLSLVSRVIGKDVGTTPSQDQRAEALNLAKLCNVNSEEIESTGRLHASQHRRPPARVNQLAHPGF